MKLPSKINNKAFSLVELSITVLIISVLVAAILGSKAVVDKAKEFSVRWNVQGASGDIKIPQFLFSKNNKLWLDARNINGNFNAGLGDGKPIEFWKDLSGNNRNAQALQKNYQPTYDKSDSNGNNGVLFTRDRMFIYGGIGIAEFEPRTLIMAIRSNSNAPNSEIFGISTGQMVDIGSYSSNLNLRLRNNTYNVYSASGTFNLKTNYILIVTFTGASTWARVNNQEIINQNSTIYFSFDLTKDVGIGATNFNSREFYNGYLNEVIVLNRVLNEEELVEVNNYLKRKWKF